MNDQEKCIRLAEAMGGARVYTEGLFRYKMYRHPVTGVHTRDNKFHPFTDANDCNALIKHLGAKWSVQVNFSSERHPAYVELYGPRDMTNRPSHRWHGDNWMHGVCELAFKVIENERLLRAAQEPCPLA